ncbi:Citrate synthase (si) [Olavius algarvensis spirochete endosymbiont]|uniref:citrate/2-methylcitrate synthase n=1 Tax=Olavius algarvensis spirochete endosymbiont TaxID=260710 RepID=UPI000F126559|nr:citrate/2-methylcitrate synthase [Olavius algarvensis spirochete endosymbiont]VDB00727.1 Citrate synthase (si) [Olavius algarvensis spirochete endosymbiont]
MAEKSYAKGLEGVIAGESKICKVDGENGRLYYYGYRIADLVEKASFEEVTYLLLYGKLPTSRELSEFTARMRKNRELKPPILNIIKEFPRSSHPMELLQTIVNFLSGYIDHKIEHSPTCNCRQTLHQIAQLPAVIAAFHRFRNGLNYISPRDDLSHGANFLWQLKGTEPDSEDGEIMDKCLTLHAEHSFNASTFTARVVASTLSTCYCSISAAIGSLFGSLHGGANEKVITMVEDIDNVENAAPWIDAALAKKQKIMGMGHRVYKAKDPRAVIMERFLQTLSSKYNDNSKLVVLEEIEKVFRERMEEKGKPIYPNVDFFSGAVYSLLGIPSSLFTPIFAMARASGWLAHILEQRVDNRLFRPKALYTGEVDRPWPAESID